MACYNPKYLKPSGYSFEIPVDCGKCLACKERRCNEWVFRLLEEDKVSTSSYFVTLTYDNYHCPISLNGFKTLRKQDFQLYMKRLRKLCGGAKLKYFAVGEYGSKRGRPHYHAIIFNCPNPDYFVQAWSLIDDDTGEYVTFGDVKVLPCTGDSVAYTLKYMDKESYRDKFWHIARNDREKEFCLMSKRLGVSYLTPEVIRYHRSHFDKLYVTKLSGHRVAMPRYYRNRIFTDIERQQQIGVVAANIEKREREAEQLHNRSGLPYSYLRKKELLYQGRLAKFHSRQKNKIRDVTNS